MITYTNCTPLSSITIIYYLARAYAWRGMWICVRSKDAQKRLTRTSLNQELTFSFH